MARKSRKPVEPRSDIESGEDEFLDQPAADEPEAGTDTDLTDAADAVQNASFSAKAREWIEKSNIENLTVTATLYKYRGNHPSQGKTQCCKYENEFPDEHNVGLVYGSGKYSMIVTYPKGAKQAPGVRRFEFELHSHYDQLKREEEMRGGPLNYGNGRFSPYPVQASQAPIDPFSGLERLLALVMPLMRPQVSGGANEMLGMYNAMAMVMRKNLTDQADFMKEIQDRMLDEQDEDPTNPLQIAGAATMPVIAATPEVSWWEKLLPLAMPFLAKIAGADAGESAAAVAAVESIPQVKEILTDTRHKEDAKKMIATIEKSLGKEKADNILKKLKIDRGLYD